MIITTFSPTTPLPCPGRPSCLLHRPRQERHQSLNRDGSTLHLRGIEASKSFVGVFFFFVLVDPLCPVDLNVLALLCGLDESWPEGGIGILLGECEEQMEAGLSPLGFLSNNLSEEFKLEGVLLASTFSLEGEMSGSEVDFFVDNVHQVQLNEDAVLPLRPFGGRMTELAHTYSIELKNLIIIIPESTRKIIAITCFYLSAIGNQ